MEIIKHKITAMPSTKNETCFLILFDFSILDFIQILSESECSASTGSQGVGACSLQQRSAKAKQLLIKTAAAH